ncbi:MAG: protein kinase [Salinivirgaceae bacterium]|nr:protein kinase [Salinivirgaceae bacterium]
MSGKEIVLHGLNEDYIFYPQSTKSHVRKVSKFSRVFKGESSDGRPVLVKMLPSELAKNSLEVDQFKREIDWYGVHPTLLAPFEYIYQDERHYLISEFVQNIDLGYYIRYRLVTKKKRIRLAIECGLQLLDAVEAMHQKNFIHADIKPANVLFLSNKVGLPYLKNPQFQLIDFGMVRHAGSPPPQTPERSKRPFVLVYSPPEQVLGFHELTSFHSDLYNIALLIYEMIIKEPAYNSNISVKIMNLQTSLPITVRKVIPKELMDILLKAASKYHFKKPPNHYSRDEVYHRLLLGIEQRYKSAAEFKEALLQFRMDYFSKHK